MNKYIKANPKVTARLGLTDVRVQFPDGNYLLMFRELLPLGLGDYADYEEILRKVGAVFLTHPQAYSEQNGGAPLELPEAELEEYRMPREETTNTIEEATEENPDEYDTPANMDEVSGNNTEEGGEA